MFNRAFWIPLCLFVVGGAESATAISVPTTFQLDPTQSSVDFGLTAGGSTDSDGTAVSGSLEIIFEIDIVDQFPSITGIEFTGGSFRADEQLELNLTLLGFLPITATGNDVAGTVSTPVPPAAVTPTGNLHEFSYDAADHLFTVDQGVVAVTGTINESIDLAVTPVSGTPPVGTLATILIEEGLTENGLTHFTATSMLPIDIEDVIDVPLPIGSASVDFSAKGAVFATAMFALDVGSDGLSGDFNGNNQVEQGDLDLVLLNWGNPASPPPENWSADLPEGTIDQNELDRVLLGWGDTATQGTAHVSAAVPEPQAIHLLLLSTAIGCMFGRREF